MPYRGSAGSSDKLHVKRPSWAWLAAAAVVVARVTCHDAVKALLAAVATVTCYALLWVLLRLAVVTAVIKGYGAASPQREASRQRSSVWLMDELMSRNGSMGLCYLSELTTISMPTF